ncbi:hypothetical protein HQ560_01795, partial [bacterium]|nr:hypothetical protein [bacterium]
FEADVTLEPVAFLGLARREGLTSSVADGVVTLQGEAFLLRVREATGEIEELTVPRVLAGGTLRIAFVPGRFEQHRKALDALPRDAVRSVSVVELLALFLTRSAPRAVLFARGTAEEHGRAAKAIIHLVRGAAAPLAEAGAARRKEGDLFILPISAGAGGIPELLAQVAIPAARRIFPKRSWPVTLVREAALVACGRGQYTTIVLGQLYQSEDTGPIGCLTTAWLLGYVNGDMARVFARRGLERLSIGAFRKDAGIVLATDGMVSKMLSGFRQAALELSDEDVEALDVVLMPDYGRVVVSFLQSIRGGRPEAEPRAALAAALDAWWKETLRPRVARALQGIVGGTENAP